MIQIEALHADFSQSDFKLFKNTKCTKTKKHCADFSQTDFFQTDFVRTPHALKLRRPSSELLVPKSFVSMTQ